MMCSATQWLDTNAGIVHLMPSSLLILFMANSLITDVVFDSQTLAMLKMLHKFGAPIAKTTHWQQVLWPNRQLLLTTCLTMSTGMRSISFGWQTKQPHPTFTQLHHCWPMFTHPELWFFAANWYRLLDIHAPLDSFRPLLTDDVQLVFPEATVTGFEGYTGWYNNVVKIFFDEEHTLKVADITKQSDDACEAHVVVNWHASIWNAPEARSTAWWWMQIKLGKWNASAMAIWPFLNILLMAWHTSRVLASFRASGTASYSIPHPIMKNIPDSKLGNFYREHQPDP